MFSSVAGNTPVHDHHGACGGIKPLEHFFQGTAFRNIAVKHPGTTDKPAVVQHQPERYQRAVAALFL